jgi:cytochrome c oxidase subunit 2
MTLFLLPAHDAWRPAGVPARHIAALGHVFLVACLVAYAAIVLSLVAALVARRRTTEPAPPEAEPRGRRTVVVSLAVALTVALLVFLLVASVSTGRERAAFAADETVRIEVTGHQWWWQVTYPDAVHPSRMVETANEIRIPRGRKVRLVLRSADVIHSFWAPSLDGKRDLIPGHETEDVLEVDEDGTWRVQCAEFCGLQHAHMAMDVTAVEPADFDAWLAAGRAPAVEPATTSATRGREVFLSSPCVLCHAIGGTTAGAHAGPDLTHVGSRATLAAGTLPNDKDSLATWITDPASVKPGTPMPPTPLSKGDLDALVAYLEGLR